MTPPPAKVKGRREHYWDTIRGFLLVLGIPYHASLVYDIHSKWAVKSPQSSDILAFLCEMIHTFRMPVFFMLAGYFAAMLLFKREPMTWLRGRVLRLGLPFITAAILLNPIQVVASAHALAINGIIPPTMVDQATWSQLTHLGNQWVRHLWFLESLIFYSVILAILFPTIRAISNNENITGPVATLFTTERRILILITSLTAVWLIGVEGLFYLLYRIGAAQPLNGMLNIEPTLHNIPFFAIGVTMRFSPKLLRTFQTGGKSDWPASIILMVLCAWTGWQGALYFKILNSLLSAMAAIIIARAIITLSIQKFDRPNPYVEKIVDASFSIYLFHQPIISILGTYLLTKAWNPILEFLLITAVTLVISYILHVLIKKNDTMMLLLNGVIPKKTTVAA